MASKRDPKSDDGESARSDFRKAQGKKAGGGGDRKTAQLCSQVRRTLEMALLGEVRDEVVTTLEVVTVDPMPDATRLRVLFHLHDPAADLAEVRAHLQRSRGVMIAEVARAITRRKLPDLVFEVERAPA